MNKLFFTNQKWALLIFALVLAVGNSQAGDQPTSGQVNTVQDYGKIPLQFEMNAGQADPQARYYTRGNGYTIYFAPTEVILALDVSTNRESLNKSHRDPNKLTTSHRTEIGLIHFKLEGAGAETEISPEAELPGKVNYFIGNEPAQWHANVPVFSRVRYQRAYPGVDVVFYGNQSQLEYDFVVAPQADPRVIKLKLEGVEQVEIDQSGDLVLRVRGSSTRLHKPVAYQTINGVRASVASSYRLQGRQVTFELGNYDQSQPLVIDPVLSYSSFIGNAKSVRAYGVAVDSSDHAYIGGATLTVITNLITSGAFQTNFGGADSYGGDVFVAKVNPSGTALDYMTYLGGNKGDYVYCIAVDQQGNAYVAGLTDSGNFPTTTNSFQPKINSAKPSSSYYHEAFITKLNTNGSALVYSSYLGGVYDEWIYSVAVDDAGSAFICGVTHDTPALKFPITNAFDSVFSGSTYNGFAAKVNSNGTALVYCTYIGGSDETYAEKVAVDGIGCAYVTGFTTSGTGFPITTNTAFQKTFGGGGFDGFLVKISPDGKTNLYSTFVGGNDDDWTYGIALDASTNIYLAGGTWSTNFFTTNAIQPLFNGGINRTNNDGLIMKLSPDGKVVFSTYFGGANLDNISGLAVQTNGDLVVVGNTGSIDFAPYYNYGSINSGGRDGFVAKLNSAGTVLMNFAYLGGTNYDSLQSLALDSKGNAYVVGFTASKDYPITGTNVVDSTFNGLTNAFITKIYFEPNQLGTRVTVSWQNSDAWSLLPATTLAASNNWAGTGQFASVNSNGVTSLASTRFQRGAGFDPTYTSFVIPLSFQTGARLDDLGNNSENFGGTWPWFTQLQSDIRTHLSLVSSTSVSGVCTSYYSYVTNFSNPIAAFGSTAGGSPLYLNSPVRFGVYCGAQYESTNSDSALFQTPLRVLVYQLSNYVAGQTNPIAPMATNFITLPRRTITGDQSAWNQFATNGFSLTIETNGLRTTVQLADESSGAWGVVPQFANARSGTYIVTHEATTNLGYGYVLEGIGVVPLNTNLYPMVTNSSGALDWDRLYAVEFQVRPPWRSVFIDQPQFNGQPLPSFYQGASLAELTNLNAVVTNVISLTGSAYTNLDYSPELRRHPTLDKLVSDLNNDPIALANYVINRIELTDALAYNENTGQASAPVVNESGVNRGALGVYLEGQGSPVEQCALLVYLLRQAGYPAAFVFPTNNNVQLADTRLSNLLRMQVHGALTQNGQTFTTNSLITVNYPWVAVSISNTCVHIFPWLKDTEISEGLNLYDYMPTNYDNGFKWLRNYLYGDTNILSLSLLSDAPSVLFPAFIKQQLLTTAPGISLDDIGLKAFNRQHYYSRWQDFPTPSVVTSQSQVVCVDSLTSAGITNVSPGMTNLFNTVSVTIYSQNNPTNLMTVGPLRTADLHNREMFVATNSAGNLMLWLAPFIVGNTNQSAFDATDPALTNKQIAILPLTNSDVHFAIRMTHNRHQAVNFTPSPNQFLDVSETLQFTTPDRPFNLPDLTAICINVGRVTPAMLDVHAGAYQQMAYQWQLNTNMTPAVEDYQAHAAYLMGMDYYAKVSQFLPANERLHKCQVVSWFAEGLSKLTPMQLGAQNFMRPSLDMFFSEIAYAGNGTSHPDSGNDPMAGTDDFSRIMTGEIAAQEHSLINGYYQSSNSVSSVVLLRLTQQRAATNVSGIIELNKNNYLTLGNTNPAGYGPTKLKDYDTDIWSSVTNAFQGWDADYVRAYLTPGPVSVAAASYRGMGLVIVGKSQSASIISVNMNGVLGQPSTFFGDAPARLSTIRTASAGDSYSLDTSIYNSYLTGGNLYGSSIFGASATSYYWTNPGWQSYLPQSWLFVQPVRGSLTVPSFTSPSQVDLARQINNLYSLPSSTPAVTSLTRALDSGNSGATTWKNFKNFVADPVSVISGEFYHDAVDLTLAGPQPLQLRRNYSSQNLGDRNGFGYGWNINLVSYLSLATNTTAQSTNVILTAVDLNGSVIGYRQQVTNLNLYLPTVQDNPQLDNFGGGRSGSIYNPFNARIRHSFVGTNELYTLTASDGQVRTFTVNSFPIIGSSGTIARQRPYLTSWLDTEGNTWTFSYGTNPDDSDYGSLVRVQCSNGNYLGLYYNAGGYVTEGYTGDGQRTSYEYDDFGDLIQVTRVDASEETYQYQHTQFTNSNVIYVDSTHLLTGELKPDGRILRNVYDNQRRVTVQMATVGPDLNVYTNAIFTYSNNYVMPMTNAISGYTLVKDVNGNTNRYDYTNSLVTLITDPFNQTIQQNWYSDTATAPGYPRSPSQIKDQRGMWTQFLYDSFGNVTNVYSWGDLTGDGTTHYATNTMAYDTNNLPTQITDPVGNQMQVSYHPQYPFLPQYLIRSAGGTSVSTNQFSYYNVTNVVVNGYATFTNVALGLLRQSIRAVNSPDAATNQLSFDGRGFLTQQIQYTGTGDPAVTNTFSCDSRGEIIETVNAAGRKTALSFDAMGRPISRAVFEANQSQPIFWEQAYFNGHGELTWSDGPRFNPEDYVWRDYDGAGRLTTEIHWRAEAKPDGSGVQAPGGYNLYAQSFNEFDKFGNLTRSIDPRTAITTNTWDALGRLVLRKRLETNGAVLAGEGFTYEPGGLVRYHTNALNGVSETQYTTNGLPKFRRNADGSTNAWRYYLDGRIQKEIQGNGAYWQTTYDDPNRTVKRIFYSAAASPLATNIAVFDRRGNLNIRTDAGGNSFTNFYDGLDRLKAAVGPAIASVFEQCDHIPGCGVFVTNIFQPAITNYFDAAGVMQTSVNALGEKTIAFFDALGRPTRMEIRNAANVLVRESSAAYSQDFHSVTVTNGSGSGAMVSTAYTDNDDRALLSVMYPAANAQEYMRNAYDLAGNLTYQAHASATNGAYAEWSYGSYAYNGLNRLTAAYDRDNAPTTFAFDAAGDLTNRVMPGGLKWQASYNSAGQLLQEKNVGNGGATTRTNTYVYYSAGNPFAGLPQTRTDGRGVTCTYTYDDWLRLATNTHTGALNEQNLTTTWRYEARGLLTNVSQSFALSATGPSTTVQRTYNVYGQPSSESVFIGGSALYGASQSWDAAGRRTYLGLGNNYGFGWRADGLLSSVSVGSTLGGTLGSGSYGYTTAGLLTSRAVGSRVTSINSRDGLGRPLSIGNTLNAQTKLTETLTWTGDGLPSTHTLERTGDFTDSRQFFYANHSRRLNEERLNLDATRRWTNVYTFDNGTASGPGVLTKIGQTASGSQWSGATDAFSRIGTETNTATRQLTYGRVNGPATITASLDGAAQPVTVFPTGDHNWTNQWRTTMDMTPGAHQLTVSAAHPSGLFTTNATIWFTNNIGNLAVADTMDAAGNLTQRIWRKPNGNTNLVQTLAWDGQARLCKVTERDSTQSGRDLAVVYDAFGRRLQTTEITVTNNIALTNQPIVVSHFFDPMAEFLELGVNDNGKITWKLMGPDMDGSYGSQNGTGGFEAEATALTFSPTVNDAFGNVLARYDQNTLTWNNSRLTGYGGVPGHRPLTLGSSGSLAAKYAWRNRASESVGLTWMGGNWLDSTSGRFISPDPLGHDGSPSLYSFCGGSPVGYMWDADGRLGKQYTEFQYNGGAAGYGLRGLAGYMNQIGSLSSGTLSSWGAYNDASLLNMAASAVSPSSYVNGFNSLQNRAENVMVGQYLNGSGTTWSAAQGLSSIVGDATGYNGIMAGSFGVDRQSQTMLSTSDRWSQGLMGGSQMILTGVGLKSAYNPNATLLSPATSTVPAPGLRARVPADLFRYAKHPTSRILGPGVEDGTYVFVQDVQGTVHIAQNGPHMHPQVLGNATAVASAGEITIQNGVVVEINNLSGTFRPAANTLNQVQKAVQSQGLLVAPTALKPFVWPSN